LTVHLVKRERRRSDHLEELVHSLHARHDVLEKGLGDAVSASERAEAAALKAVEGTR
jgi:hypothetical protein